MLFKCEFIPPQGYETISSPNGQCGKNSWYLKKCKFINFVYSSISGLITLLIKFERPADHSLPGVLLSRVLWSTSKHFFVELFTHFCWHFGFFNFRSRWWDGQWSIWPSNLPSIVHPEFVTEKVKFPGGDHGWGSQ